MGDRTNAERRAAAAAAVLDVRRLTTSAARNLLDEIPGDGAGFALATDDPALRGAFASRPFPLVGSDELDRHPPRWQLAVLDAHPSTRRAVRWWSTAARNLLDERPAGGTGVLAAPAALQTLKVLLVCHEATRTGAPMALLGIAQWLVDNGATIATLVLVPGPLEADFARLGRVLRPRGDRLDAGDVSGFDIVYVNTVVPSDLAVELASRGHRVVLHAHELGHAIDSIGRRRVCAALTASRHLLAVSAASEAALRRTLGPLERAITRVSEPLPAERFALAESVGRHRHDDASFVIGGFGTFCWLKGGDLLARCAGLARLRAEELDGREWAFRWVGQRGGDAAALLDALQREGLPDALEQLGEQAQPLALVRSFDILAMLSRQDSYPLAMLEAALVGVPLLAQRDSGGPEEFAASGGGVIVDAEDPDAVLTALGTLRRHPELRSIMAEVGYRKVRRENSMGSIGPKIASALFDALAPDHAVLARARVALVPAERPARPEVSIVTPVFNRVDMTERCLRALARTVDPATTELVVVDNGSSDGSAELVARLWPPATIVRNGTNLGFARGCNQGISAASAARIVLLNNDTEATSGWLEALLAPLQDPAVGIVAPRLLFPDGTLQHAGMALIEDRKNGLRLNAIHLNYREAATTTAANRRRELQLVTGAVMALRREVFETVGGFDEGYWNGCEDVELCLQVAAAGYRIVYEPSAVLLHHESASGAERWTKLSENLARLTDRWASRATVDLVVLADGSVVPLSGAADVPLTSGLNVTIEGEAFVYHSLSQVNRELGTRLAADHGMNVSVHGLAQPELTAHDDPRLAALVVASTREPQLRADVTIRHRWPPNWQPPADVAPVVVVQPWEFGGLPDEWIEPLRDWPDEIWCYTTWVRDCYVRSGVPADRLAVVPLGVDSERFRPDGPRHRLEVDAAFRFLFVGGLIQRKGIDVLLDAYGCAFSDADDVCLVIKAFGINGVYRGASGEALIERHRRRPHAPRIELITDDLDQDAIAALYRSCDALVHPYRGEGFGMPIAEAMASGLPVIVTNDGAAMDFCDETSAFLVPSRRAPLSPAAAGLGPSRAGYWLAEPDVDALASTLRRVYGDPIVAAEIATAGRARVLEQLSWTAAAAVAAARLEALAGAPARRLGGRVAEGSVEPYRLDETRRHVVACFVGDGHEGWPAALEAAGAVLTARDDVTLVVALGRCSEARQAALLEDITTALAHSSADVLVVLDVGPAEVASLLVRAEAAICGEAELAAQAQRLATAVIRPTARHLRQWLANVGSARAA